jgi:hypothetical protein
VKLNANLISSPQEVQSGSTAPRLVLHDCL